MSLKILKKVVSKIKSVFTKDSSTRVAATKTELVFSDDFTKGLNTDHWEKITYANTPWRYNKSTIDALFEQTSEGLKIKIIKNTNQDYKVPTLQEVVLNDDKSNINDVVKYQTSQYLTGGIWTNETNSIKYGKVQVVASIHACNGSWDSIWMSGCHNNCKNENGTLHITTGAEGYNDSSEIDMLEYYKHNETAWTTIHDNYLNSTLTTTEANNAEQARKCSYKIDKPEDFHIYSCMIMPEYITVSIDGKQMIKYKNLHKKDEYGFEQYPFSLDGNPLRVILDTQWAGNKYLLDKFPETDDSYMIIKSVKLWRVTE